MAEKNSVMDLLTDEIKDLYSAEKQLTKAIPKAHLHNKRRQHNSS